MAADWSFDDVSSLDGQVVVVTGANSGVGREATAVFADRGATVVMACRSLERAEAAAEEIREGNPDGTLDVRECDLADLESVATFADGFVADYDDLHVLCNNAGVMALPRSKTVDGYERQFAINHLGHFALTGRLFEQLRQTPGESRVVTQSSNAHRQGEIDFADLHGEDSYDYWGAYAQSKLANLLFAFELDRRCRAADLDVASVACHPGYADTELQGKMASASGSWFLKWSTKIAATVFAQSARGGAMSLVYAATHPDVESGDYVGPGGFLNMRGEPELQEPAEKATEEADAERLWEVSTDLTGVTYDALAPVQSAPAEAGEE